MNSESQQRPAHDPRAIDFSKGLRPEHYLYFSFFAKFTNVPLARLAYRCGISANGVTLIGTILCLPAAVLNVLGHHYAAIALFHCFFVLDCVDGVVARATRTTSPIGGYLDDLAHAVFHTVFFLSAGYGYLRDGDPWLGFLNVGCVLTANLLCWHLDLRHKFFAKKVAPAGDGSLNSAGLLKDLVIGTFVFPNILLWLTALSWHRVLLGFYLGYVLAANLAYTFYIAARTVRENRPGPT